MSLLLRNPWLQWKYRQRAIQSLNGDHPPQESSRNGDLTRAIRTYITGWNTRAHPFVWTKTADDILKKTDRQPISNTRH